ncbi:MAG: DUF1194 domain-containing protein [Ahrensia sp.]
MKAFWLIRSLLVVAALAWCAVVAPARAEQVDVELVLAVDVSGSMSSTELRLQRRGYAEAFRSSQVHNAIADGLLGTIAVMYVEWARSDLKKVIVPWSIISTPEEANNFADRLLAAEYGNMRNTSITGAIQYSQQQLDINEAQGLRRVIDISGDGPNNQGGLVTVARDAAVAEGIVINGLPLVVETDRRSWAFEMPNLDVYYRDCVIGGPGSFVMAVDSWERFDEVVRRKIVLELAGLEPELPVQRANFLEPERVDCTIGERMRRIWDDP